MIDGGKYLRAASDSKTGGSDTISVEQMPRHSHTSVDSIVHVSGNTSGPCVADSANTPAWWYAWANSVAMSYTGGGATVLPDVPKHVRLVQSRLTKRAVMSSGIH